MTTRQKLATGHDTHAGSKELRDRILAERIRVSRRRLCRDVGAALVARVGGKA